MDQEGVELEADKTTPLFGAYRRGGYDPEQVDRYVAEQARRLEQSEQRASEAERRLAAAVGQLRELHRRVAVLESEDRSPKQPSLDTLGERVQRILKEAWEGAYALRQGAEQEVAETRARAAAEAEEIVATAEARARQIDEEIDRRRKAYIAALEEDRSRAVAQVSYLHEQRRAALTELLRVKEIIEETVGEASGRAGMAEARIPGPVAPASDPAAPFVVQGDLDLDGEAIEEILDDDGATPLAEERPEEAPAADAPLAAEGPIIVRAPRARTEQPAASHVIASEDLPTVAVRSFGALVEEDDAEQRERFDASGQGLVRRLADEGDDAEAEPPGATLPGVFDFEEE